MITNKTTERGAFNFNPFPHANRVTDSSGSRAERGSPNEGKRKWVCSPRPRAARSAADGAQPEAAPPRRATRFAEGWNHPSPWCEISRGKPTLPLTTSREMRPARPAGGGFPNFADFLGYTRSARHWNILRGTLNSANLHVNFPGYPPGTKIPPPPPGEGSAEPTKGGTRPARVLRNHFPLYDSRAPDTMNLSFPIRAGAIQSFFWRSNLRASAFRENPVLPPPRAENE